jgi:ABC-2 type transport system ATP-binding protein
MYFVRLCGFSKTEAKKIVNDLLNKMGLIKDAEKRVSDYSGGMRKRLEVATALLPGIKILILDEPTTGLDPSARKDFLGLIRDINKEGTTVILVTHIGEDAKIASNIGFMDEGTILMEGAPEHLKIQSGLQDIINVETSIKNEEIWKLLQPFSNNGNLLETETGYKIFSERSEEILPEILTILNKNGYKSTRIEIKSPSLEDIFFKITKKSLKREEN